MQTSKCRILLVDDHASIRYALRELLTQYADIEIVGEAGDGKQAINEVASCQPDIVLMDLNMPRMNGIEAASVIVKSWKDTIIIGLCVLDDSYIMDRFLMAGANAVISKERFNNLHAIIQRAWANRASAPST